MWPAEPASYQNNPKVLQGGGGQVGNWTGPRPNFAGELLDVGIGRLTD